MSDKHELGLQNMSTKNQTALLMKHAEGKAVLSKEHAKQLSALKEYNIAEKTTQHQDYNKNSHSMWMLSTLYRLSNVNKT